MLIKFLPRGTGSGRGAAAYLLSQNDHRGVPRAGVEVLKGNPNLVARLIDSLEFKNKYTSGVIAWAPEDRPTQEQIKRTLEEFEKVAFAGLEPDQFTWIAIQHREAGGGTHIHVLIPRVELITGKSFNAAPPGWAKDFDPLRDWLNREYGWSRPDDPGRARVLQPRHEAFLKKEWSSQDSHRARSEITEWLLGRIKEGLVRDREGVLASLREIGEITREGEAYISLRPQGFSKAIRLKGAMYERRFSIGSLKAPSKQEGGGPEDPGRFDGEGIQVLRRKFEQAVERRAQYNRQRYRIPQEEPFLLLASNQERARQILEREHGMDFGARAKKGVCLGNTHRGSSRFDYYGVSALVETLKGVGDDRAGGALIERIGKIVSALRRGYESVKEAIGHSIGICSRVEEINGSVGKLNLDERIEIHGPREA